MRVQLGTVGAGAAIMAVQETAARAAVAAARAVVGEVGAVAADVGADAVVVDETLSPSRPFSLSTEGKR